MRLKAGFSPCPNDTYLLNGWVHGKISSLLTLDPVLDDVQQLNEWALDGVLPFTKISFAILPRLLHRYITLPVGAALGRGCGPKVVSLKSLSLNDLSNAIVAIPGRDTTACLLLERLAPRVQNPLFCTYDQVVPLVLSGQADAGVIIHETRFTYAQAGLMEIADLGQLWEARTGLPLPLGCYVAKRSLGQKVLDQITRALSLSLSWAHQRQEEDLPYILKYSQEKRVSIVMSHIDLYVNQHTAQLDSEAVTAIERLLKIPASSWLHPTCC